MRTQILLMHLKVTKKTASGQSSLVTQEFSAFSKKKKGILQTRDIILCKR